MNNEQIISEIKKYEIEFSGILSRFKHTREGIHIGQNDDSLFRQYTREVIDLFNDTLGLNNYSIQIANEANYGLQNWLNTPSYKSVDNILATIRAALTRLNRNPDLLTKKKSEDSLQHRENIFIIHGSDEAKWRELKDVLKSEFRLNPIILSEQPDAGCNTIIEKFEFYARSCSYAIAVFTPDDQVSSGSTSYLQARPNVIYELGWFCGRLGRKGAMLLLKEGTELFSDFGGIIQKRFKRDIAEKIIEIRKDLIAAGILEDV